MAQRYQLVSPRPKKDGGTHWHPIGSAWAKENGSFSLVFDSLPIPDKDGRVMVLMSEPLERNDNGGQRQQRQGSSSNARQASFDAQAPHRDIPDDTDLPF